MKSLPREVLDLLEVSRLQENVGRKFSQMEKGNDDVSACLGGSQTNLGNNSFKVAHSLGREPKGFIIIDQGSTSSIKARMTNPNGTDATITFDSDPTSFKVSFY